MSEPHMQNIPIRTELSDRLRKAFEQEQPELVMRDFSEIELRLVGNMTDAEIAQFLRGPYGDR